jgi:uncharacterized membrane protein
MRNLFVYYFAILLPIPLMVWAASNGNSTLFVVLLLSYVVYRGFTDSKRLVDKRLIKQNEAWKVFIIPFYSAYFFKELYFEK